MSAVTAISWVDESVLPATRRVVRPSRRARSARAARSGDAARTGRAVASGHLRLTARGRLVVWSLAVAVAAAVGLSAQSAGADAPRAPLAVETHVVAPGETLWQIAGAVAAPGADLRDVVAKLVELNGLGDAGLQAGQEILVPVAD